MGELGKDWLRGGGHGARGRWSGELPGFAFVSSATPVCSCEEKPNLVLRDTLCSCEAYGMKPMYKKKNRKLPSACSPHSTPAPHCTRRRPL